MPESAQVFDLSVLRDLQSAVGAFREEVVASLEALHIELLRAFEWVEHDRPAYWERQMQRAFDLVASTRMALHTCQMRTVAGHKPACIEEKQAHEAAKRRLQHCLEQRERCKRWAIKIRHDADEFRGRIAGLQRVADAGAPETLLLLERMATALENYAEILNAPAEQTMSSEQSAASDAPTSQETTSQGETP